MPVGGVGGGTKAVVEGKIVEALTEAGVDDAEEVLTGALPSGVGDTDDDANGGDIDEVAAAGGPKGEVGVWPVLVVVIAGGGSAADAGFTIGSTAGAGPVPVGGVGAGTTGVVEGKIGEALTWAGAGGAGDADDKANGAGADEVSAGRWPEGEVGVKTPNFRGFLPKSDSSSQLI